MKNIIIFSTLLVTLCLTNCTEQERAKNFGGTANVELSKNQKLVNATWKEDDMWLLTKPMTETDKAERYEFQESSSYGILQGKVIIQESK